MVFDKYPKELEGGHSDIPWLYLSAAMAIDDHQAGRTSDYGVVFHAGRLLKDFVDSSKNPSWNMSREVWNIREPIEQYTQLNYEEISKDSNLAYLINKIGDDFLHFNELSFEKQKELMDLSLDLSKHLGVSRGPMRSYLAA